MFGRLSTGDFRSQLKKEDDRGAAHGSEAKIPEGLRGEERGVVC